MPSMPTMILAIWLTGFISVLLIRFLRFRRVAVVVGRARPVESGREVDIVRRAGKSAAMTRDIPVCLSDLDLEPGIFGTLKPVLLLPATISTILSDAQLEAVASHELCHARRRDNLTASVHMSVEALFWFHPATWWIGRHLIEERELACDEEVIRIGADPESYARGILNICKLYVPSPVECMAGVTGPDLVKRIERIMTPRANGRLTLGKKLLLIGAGTAALIVPVLLGAVNASQLRAQAPDRHLTFEAASVKKADAADYRGMRLEFLPGGRLAIKSMPLLLIVATAYNVPFQSPRLTGGPDWEKALREAYDIEATAPKGTIPAGISSKERNERMRLMLQSLLDERFKMRVRREPKEQPAYVITVAKGGPKLQPSKLQESDCVETPGGPMSPSGCHSLGGGIGRGLHGDAVTIADVALYVQNWSDKPVVDNTGLTGLYNIQTEGWQPMRPRMPNPDGSAPNGGDAGINDPDRQTLFDVFRQLGLKMDSQRAVVDMFYVEHVERPIPN
jgi:uncharacterized protein (TIGR03435 family)